MVLPCLLHLHDSAPSMARHREMSNKVRRGLDAVREGGAVPVYTSKLI